MTAYLIGAIMSGEIEIVYSVPLTMPEGWGDAGSVRAAGVGEEAITLSVECAMEPPTTGGHLVASAAATVRVHTAKCGQSGG